MKLVFAAKPQDTEMNAVSIRTKNNLLPRNLENELCWRLLISHEKAPSTGQAVHIVNHQTGLRISDSSCNYSEAVKQKQIIIAKDVSG